MTFSQVSADTSSNEAKIPLVVSISEMPIDFVPDITGVSLAESVGFIKAPGRAPANIVVAITKLGGRSAFIGKIGDDEFRRKLGDILKKNGVNGDGVRFVTLKKNGGREFMFYRNPSADMHLRESELNLDLIQQAKIFH